MLKKMGLLLGLLTIAFCLESAFPKQTFAATPASVTFLTANCTPSSLMYQQVQANADPHSSDNGTIESVPSDISTYGCTQFTGNYNLYILGDSTPNALYLDLGLTNRAVYSTSSTGFAGNPSTITPGQKFYIPANQSAKRHLSIKEFPFTNGTYAGMPFLDIQCYQDGYNNDNLDGMGWTNLSLPAGKQAYCILYIAQTVTPTPTPSPSPTPTPTPTPPGGPPASTATIVPSNPNGSNSWYITPLDIIFSATDLLSGVASINWKVDTGTLNIQTFSNTLNLAPNPSFEDVSSPPVTSWIFLGQPGATGSRDATTAKFGIASIKISSAQNGWSGFSNQATYVPATPFSNMSASVWLKTSSVMGTGGYFRVYALSPSGSTLIAQNSATTGTNDWLRTGLNFYVSVNNAYGVYLDIGLDGVGTVWYDGVVINNSLTDTKTTQTFSQNGDHTTEYYAVNNYGIEETPHNSINFKIDTVSPTSWGNFSTTQQGNDHTLATQIDVNDNASGIDPAQGFFQYSVDGGTNWGYYSNLTACNSNWVTDGWQNLNTALSNGNLTATLSTPAIDFCNSNWAVCKIVRYKTADISSNPAQKDVCINGVWFSISGDVGSRYAISLNASGSSDNSDGVVFSATTITNFTSSNSWYVENYLLPDKPTYNNFLTKFQTSQALPNGKLPTISGRFITNSDFTISSGTIPANFGTSVFNAVVFVNGDLTINSNFSLNPDSSIVFIVADDIRIDKNVTNLSGIFISDENIDTSYNGNSGNQLVINGSLLGTTVSFDRSINPPSQSSNTPAVKINYDATYINKMPQLLGSSTVSWHEISP